jgi:hypothetical protein
MNRNQVSSLFSAAKKNDVGWQTMANKLKVGVAYPSLEIVFWTWEEIISHNNLQDNIVGYDQSDYMAVYTQRPKYCLIMLANDAKI